MHQSDAAESGISIYAQAGGDAVIHLMKNKGNFAPPTHGGTGFSVSFDGGTNQFKIRSGDDSTVHDRLTIERDSGDVALSGNLDIASGKTYQINGTDIFTSPSLGTGSAAVTQSVGNDSLSIATTEFVLANAGGGEADPTFLNQNNDASTRLTFSGVGYGSIDLRELTVDETNVFCFTSHNSGAAHMGVELPLLSTVTPGTKFTIRNLSANHSVYMNTHPSDQYSGFVIKWSATNPQLKSSPWSIGDSKRVIELYAYRTGSVNSYTYRWITVEFDTN